MQEKKELRQRIRAERKALSTQQRNAETTACARLLINWLGQRPTAVVASYLATGSELDLDQVHQHLWQTGHVIWFPRVGAEQTLSWHPVAPPAHLVTSSMDISEPDPAHHPAQALPPTAVMLVPGLGFTAAGHRLGQGQGFYDRALQNHQGPAIGLGFTCQGCEKLPLEPHDRPLDGVLLGGLTLLLPP